MVFNSKILLPRYSQVREAFLEYSLKVLERLGSGNKSRSKIRKLNVLSMWVDYIGNVLSLPKSKAAKSPTPVLVSFGEFNPSHIKAVLSLETKVGKTVPLCVTDFLDSYENLGSLITDIVTKINTNKHNPTSGAGIQPHGISATRGSSLSIKLSFQQASTFNNAIVTVNQGTISLTSTTAMGGVDAIPFPVLQTEESYKRIVHLLDKIAIELDIVYKTEEQLITESIVDRTRTVERRDNRITIDRDVTLSDEKNRNIEL